ncbi:conserved hypothetical protein [Streptomyces misionensis JCM 4497]
MPSGGPGGGLYYESNGAARERSAERHRLRWGPPHRSWHTGRMLQHATFVFTYGIRPAGCHGRAA